MSFIELGNRLKSVRIGLDLSQVDFAKKLEITDKTLRNYENGKNITVDFIKKVSDLTNTDFNYLLNGNSNNEQNQTQNNYQISVNLYKDVYASAGYGTMNSELIPTKMNFDKEFLREIFNITDFKNLDIIRVIGDSMLPYIKDGEYIFVQREAKPKNGDTIIANIDDELYVKRYYKIPFEKWIKLESDNPDYPTINIDSDEKLNSLQIVGIVRSKIKLY